MSNQAPRGLCRMGITHGELMQTGYIGNKGTSKFTAPTAGLYLVQAAFGIAWPSGGYSFKVAVTNGEELWRDYIYHENGSGSPKAILMSTVLLARLCAGGTLAVSNPSWNVDTPMYIVKFYKLS